MTRLAIQIPPFCAACYNRPDDSTWVDFEAAYDGPVIPGSPAHVPVDDLILCENCVKEAARLVGMVHDDATKARLAELEQALVESREREADKDKWISNLEKSVGFAIDHPVHRPHGKPRIDGPPEKAAEVKELRKTKVAEEKREKARREKKKVAA